MVDTNIVCANVNGTHNLSSASISESNNNNNRKSNQNLVVNSLKADLLVRSDSSQSSTQVSMASLEEKFNAAVNVIQNLPKDGQSEGNAIC